MARPEQSPDALLAFALFDLDPRVRQLQHPLHLFLASLALYRAAKPLTIEDLKDAVTRELPHGSSISEQELRQAVKAGTNGQLFAQETQNGRVTLTDERTAQMAAAAGRLAQGHEAFCEFLRTKVEQQLGTKLAGEAENRLQQEVRQLLQQIFQEKSVGLAKAFGPGGGGFDESMDLLPKKSLSRIASRVVPQNDPLRRAQVGVGIRDALLQLPVEGQAHLAAEYEKTIAFALLSQDPTVRRVRRDLAGRRVGYLDTNVAMALLFSAHPKHDLALRVVETAKAAGCALRVSRFTLDELSVQMKESDERMKRLHVPGEVLSLVKDDIVRTFRSQATDSPGITWTGFFATFQPPDAPLRALGIEADLHSWGPVPLDSRRDAVRQAVRRHKPTYLPDELIDFDAHNLLLVQVLREEVPPDELGNRIWLVTIDRSLRGADRGLIRDGVFPFPSSIRAQAWCTYVASELGPEDDSLKRYLLHLVQSQLGLLAEDPAFVDTNFLITLQESPFNLDQLLSQGVETTRRVLIALQKEKEIKALLRRPPRSEQEAGPWVENLAAALDRALAGVQSQIDLEAELKTASGDRDHARRTAETLRRERDEQLRRVAELEAKAAASATEAAAAAESAAAAEAAAAQQRADIDLYRSRGRFSRLRDWLFGR